jgi:FixJ family two-component response regulator
MQILLSPVSQLQISKGGSMSERQPTVFLLDDEESVVIALSRLLQVHGFCVLTWTSATEFLAAHDADRPGCIVADVHMPGMSGLELQRALQERDAERLIVFITARGDMPTTVQAMKAGAVTFLSKPVRSAELVAAVREAMEKDAEMRLQRSARHEVLQRLATLTPREGQVLELVATGLLNKQIAGELGASEKTIKVHRGRLMAKMHVRTAAALVRLLSVVRPRLYMNAESLADVTHGRSFRSHEQIGPIH